MPKVSHQDLHASHVSSPVQMRGGYTAATGSSMPHPARRVMLDEPRQELPRTIPRAPMPMMIDEQNFGIPGSRRFIAETRPMRPSQVAKCMASKYSGLGDPHAHSDILHLLD